MSISVDNFVQRLAECGLLADKDVRALAAALPLTATPEGGDQAARELVKRGILTPFQASEIEAGRQKNLVLGNYVILDKLGEGGMGVVYKAHHRRMKRIVALKVLSPAITKTPEVLLRFEREVEAAARLSHPNIVRAYDSDEHGDTHFLVMEFVVGKDLETVLREYGPQSVERAIHWTLQAARGLVYAHECGLIHRDIKPGNLLLDRQGTIKILDMGLARIEFADYRGLDLTQSGQLMGTVDYMAPEQATDLKSADARSDIYSLGCTLYRLLTDRPLYEGSTFVAKLMAHREAPLPSLTNLRSDVPPAVETIFRKMVAKRPNDRFQSMAEVVAALEGVKNGIAAAMAVGGSEIVGPGGEPRRESLGEQVAQLDTVVADRLDRRTVRFAPPASRLGSRYAILAAATVSIGLLILISAIALLFWQREDAPIADAGARPGGANGQAIGGSPPVASQEAPQPPDEIPVPVAPPSPIPAPLAVDEGATPPQEPPQEPPKEAPTVPEIPEPADVPAPEPPASVEASSELVAMEPEPQADSRLPIPDEAARQAAEVQVREVFAAQLAGAKSKEDRQKLAAELEQQGIDPNNPAEVRYAALILAEAVAVEGDDVERAMELVERRGEDFAVSVPAEKVTLLRKLLDGAQPTVRTQTLALARREFEELAPTDDYDDSLAVGLVALEIAKAASDKEAIEQITALGREVRARQEAFSEVQAALARLEADPSDAAAHLAAGRWFWFVKGDVPEGLKHLAAGADQPLATAAAADVAQPVEAEKRLQLADEWLNLAEKQDAAARKMLLARADYWYEQALPELGGLDKVRAEKQRADLAQELQPTPSSPPPSVAVAKKPRKSKPAAKPISRSGSAMYRSFLGVYMYYLDRKRMYPVINLQVPDGNLWTQEIQDKVRGRISFDEISYIGTAKIAVPADGVYVLEAERGGKVLINGLDTGGAGDIKIRKGVHTLTYEVGSHGQPHMQHARIALRHKDTGVEVPFFNTWQDIQKFVNAPIAAQRVMEVSGWEPSGEREIKLDPKSLTLIAPAESIQERTPGVKGSAPAARRGGEQSMR